MRAGTEKRRRRPTDPELQPALALAVLLFVLAAALPLVDVPALWPLALSGAVIGGFFLWGAVREEAIAGPVVCLCCAAAVPMFAATRPAIGSVASVVVAIALGEHLAWHRAARYRTPGTRVVTARPNVAWLHAAVAAAAAAVTLGAALLPRSRAWSVMAVAALGVVAVATMRRRQTIPVVSFPPPQSSQ